MDGIRLEERDAFAGLESLRDNAADAAVVDYPWEFDTANGTDRFGHDQQADDSDLYQTQPNERLELVLNQLAQVVADDGWVFVFADDELYPLAREMLEHSPLDYLRTVYWDSDRMGMGYYHRVQTYPILAAVVDQSSTKRYVRDRPDVYRVAHHGPSAEYHTQKPVGLYEKLLSPPVLRDGETVLEPFAGTFPAGVVAKRRGCRAVGFEVNGEAVALARENVAAAEAQQRREDEESEITDFA